MVIIANSDKSHPIDDEGYTSARARLRKDKGDFFYYRLSDWDDLGFHIDTITEIDPDRERIPSNAIIALNRYRGLPPEVVHDKYRLYEYDVHSTSIMMLGTELKVGIESDIEHLDHMPRSVKSPAQAMALLTSNSQNEEYLGLMTFTSSGEPVYTRY